MHHEAPWGKFTWLFSSVSLQRAQVFVSMVGALVCEHLVVIFLAEEEEISSLRIVPTTKL